MNDDNNLKLINENITVEEYLKFLLSSEGQVTQTHPKINDAMEILRGIIPQNLSKTATKFNIKSSLLSIYKKDKTVGSYYLSLFHKYNEFALASETDKTSIYKIVENLLDEANVVVHPDNEVDKYFKDTDYSFSCGVRLEEYGRVIPDKSLQNRIQVTMHLRVAFLMTLLQFRTKKFGILSNVYRNGVFSREISLCILYHILVLSLENDPTKNIQERYNIIKENVVKDIKSGVLQLPERRTFKLKTITKRQALLKEFKKSFVNEKDFSENNILKILSAFEDNFEKIKDQLFPVVIVKDPISGKMVKVSLTKYGVKSQELNEIDIPYLKAVISEDLDEYIRKQIAKKLADNSDISIDRAIEDILKRKNLDSELTIRTISDIVKPSVYDPESLSRKLMFWNENYEEGKGILGNLVKMVLSTTLLSSAVKEQIEDKLNVSGPVVFATVTGFALAGLPGAIATGIVSQSLALLSKEEKNEKVLAYSYLNNAKGYTMKDLSSLSVNNGNPYFNLLGIIFTEKNGPLSGFLSVFSKYEIVPEYIKPLKNFSVKAKNQLIYSAGVIKDFSSVILTKLGFNHLLINERRRARETEELLRNLTNTGFNKNKRDEAVSLLNIMGKGSSVFGYEKSRLALGVITNTATRAGKLGFFSLLGFFYPKQDRLGGGNPILSWVGRNTQKAVFNVGKNIGLWSRRNGQSIVNYVGVGVGTFGSRVANGVLGDKNSTNKATGNLIVIVLFIVGFFFVGIAAFSPILVSNNTAYGRGALTNSVNLNPISCNGLKKGDMPSGAVVLDVPYFNQVVAVKNSSSDPATIAGGGNMCGAASSVMIAGYFRSLPLDGNSTNLQDYMYKDQGQAQKTGLYNISQSCTSNIYNSSGKIIESGYNIQGAFYVLSGGACDQTKFQGLTQYLNKLGVSVNEHTVNNNSAQIYQLVKESIDNKNPAILSLSSPYSHMDVAIGYAPTYVDSDKKIHYPIIVNDPFRNLMDLRSTSYDNNGEAAIYDLNDSRFYIGYVFTTSSGATDRGVQCTPTQSQEAILVKSVPVYKQKYFLSCEMASLSASLVAIGKNNGMETDVLEDNIKTYMENNGLVDTTTPVQVDPNTRTVTSWGDPNQKFVGQINGYGINGYYSGITSNPPTGYGVYSPVIKSIAEKYGAKAEVLSGSKDNYKKMFDAAANGNPSVVWIPLEFEKMDSAKLAQLKADKQAGKFVWTTPSGQKINYIPNEHAVVFKGYDVPNNKVYLMDVYSGTDKEIPMDQFLDMWSLLDYQAVIISK